MKKLISIITCIILISATFSGCGEKKEVINYIYPINNKIQNYDPQIASNTDEFVLIENTFEGLVRVNDDGTVHNGVAEDWSISDDKLTYTFNIRKGTKWRINDAIKELMGEDFNPDITANDFVFALQRAASPDTQSPLFPTIACIKNAVNIKSGKLSAKELGVTAKDNYTLVITLDTPNDEFLNVLSSSIAMPCNEEFFNSTNGRYGLQAKYTLFNGQFYLRQVLESSYLLRNNESYVGETKLNGNNNTNKKTKTRIDLTLKVINDENRDKTFELIEKGYYDAAFISGTDSKKIKRNSGVTYTPYDDTTWGFVYNCKDEIFSNKSMREAFSLGISRKDSYKEEYFKNATSFAPPSCKIGPNKIENFVTNTYNQDKEKSIKLWNEGIKKLGDPEIEITVITTENMVSTVKELIQGVQSGIGSISSYSNGKPMKFTLKVEALSQYELDSKIASGEFDVAFCSFKAESPSAISFYSDFSNNNISRFDKTKLDNYILEATQTFDSNSAKQSILKCEEEIQNSYCIYPVLFESSYYTCAKNVEGIQFHPGTGRVSFVYATQKKK